MAEARLSPILTSLSGALGGFVFRTTRNGAIVANPRVRPVGTPTDQQVIVRGIMSLVTKAWKTATDQQRADWGTYASHYFPHDMDGIGAGPSGQAVFMKGNFYRQAAGLSIALSPPGLPPAAPPTSVTAGSPADDETSIKIVVAHGISVVTGYRLLVEVTESLQSPALHPSSVKYHEAAGVNASSSPVLQASGQSYTISPLRIPLTAELRYGLRAYILTPDGIPSQPYLATLVQHTV